MGQVLLLDLALVLRAAGAAARTHPTQRPLAILGWILCAKAVWLALGVAGAWAPLWPALTIGLVGGLIDLRVNRGVLRTAVDTAIVIALGMLSVPPMAVGTLLPALIAIVGGGWVIDALLRRCPKPVRVGVVLLPFVGGALLAFVTPDSARAVLSFYRVFPHVGVTTPLKGERLVLETGAVAWLDRPAGRGPFPGVLFFHGNDGPGAKQRTACLIRRALLNANILVLSVDHPGYGESPAPDPADGADSWDPLPAGLAALERLRGVPEVDDVILVGHSMGVGDALRLLSTGPAVAGAVLLGASPLQPADRDRYWYERFHEERRMRERLPWEKFLEIRDRFYDKSTLARSVPENHPPIRFVNFEEEHPYIVATRDSLFADIPGKKATWFFSNATHYFSSRDVHGVILADTRVTRRFSQQMRRFLAEFALSS